MDSKSDHQWHLLKLIAIRAKAKELNEDPDVMLRKLLKITPTPSSVLDGCRNPTQVGMDAIEDGPKLNCLTPSTNSCLQPLVKNSWEAVDPQSGMRRIKAIVDSGASDSCASGNLAPEVAVVPSEGSRRGQTFSAASKGGKPLENEGQKVVNCFTGHMDFLQKVM